MFCITAVFCVECSDGRLADTEYLAWIRRYENGLHVRKIHDAYQFDVQYLPARYRKIAHGLAETENDSLQYYELRISVTDGSDLISYSASSSGEVQQRHYYFSYQLQSDIYLEQDGKKLPCRLFHFEQSFNREHTKTFLIAFDANNQESGAILVIESSTFDSLPIRMKIFTDNPALKNL